MEIPQGTMLGFWAHPDDFTYASAGTVQRQLAAGFEVVCVTATAGEFGETANEKLWPTSQLRQIRMGEQQASLDCIGEIEHYWLDYKDNGLVRVAENEAIERMSNFILAVNPAVIVTWEREGMTGHNDHRKIAEWTDAAASLAAPNVPVLGAIQAEATYYDAGIELDKKMNVYFNIDRPPLATSKDAAVYVELTDEEIDIKMKSLEAHASQTSRMFADDALRALLRRFVSVEAFTRLR